MLPRCLHEVVRRRLASAPVVVLLGPRQVGKTALALQIAKDVSSDWLQLDMERDSDLAGLSDA